MLIPYEVTTVKTYKIAEWGLPEAGEAGRVLLMRVEFQFCKMKGLKTDYTTRTQHLAILNCLLKKNGYDHVVVNIVNLAGSRIT